MCSAEPNSCLARNEMGSALEESLKLIDQEIEKLKENIRQLRTRRNGMTLIARLPPELLARIFGFVAMDQPRPSLNLQWVSFSHVSRSWRNIALGAPNIWCIIPFHHEKWATTMLDRSKMAKLTISAEFGFRCRRLGSGNKMHLLKLAFSTPNRIREIDLSINLADFEDTRLQQLLGNLDPGSLQNLDTLCLANYSMTPFMLPEALCSGTQGVRRLEITQCCIPWDKTSHLFSGLTSLKIHINLNSPPRPSVSQLFGALRSMPRLRLLDLNESLPSVSSCDTGVLETPVPLPDLEELHLSGEMDDITNFLSHITSSRDTILDMSCTNGISEQSMEPTGDKPKFALALASFFNDSYASRKAPANSIRSLFVSSAGEHSCTWKAYICLPTNETFSPVGEPRVSLNFHKTYIDEKFNPGTLLQQIMPSLLPLCHHLQLLSLGTLGVSASNLDAFQQFTTISHIRVNGPIKPLLDSMVIRHSQHSSLISAHNRALFPNVGVLRIENGIFGSRPGAEIGVSQLQDCLMERCERNSPIDKLILRNCLYLNSDDVLSLEEIVAEVDWDEVECTSTNSESDYQYDTDGNTIYSDD